MVVGHLQLPLPGGRRLRLLPHHLLRHRVGRDRQHWKRGGVSSAGGAGRSCVGGPTLLSVLHGDEERLRHSAGGLQVAVLVRYYGDDPLAALVDHGRVLDVGVQSAGGHGFLGVSWGDRALRPPDSGGDGRWDAWSYLRWPC